MSRRASYRNGLDWIADLDESAERDAFVMEQVPTVRLLADLFGKTPREVAQAVVKLRQKKWGAR